MAPGANVNPRVGAGARTGAIVLFIILAALTAYLPLLRNDFVGWDDAENIVENPALRLPFGEQVAWSWRTTLLGVYQPLAWMFYAVQIARFDVSAAAIHVTTLGLHVLCSIVFFFVGRELLRIAGPGDSAGRESSSAIGSTAAALVFALHPLRVECVAWASGQPYVLCCLFFLLCIYAYLLANREDAANRTRWAWYGVSVACCAAALLSKGIGVSVIVVLLVLDVYPLRRLRVSWRGVRSGAAVRSIAEKLPFALLVAAAVWMGTEATASNAALSYLHGTERLAIAAYGLAFYARKTLLPIGLSAYYPLPTGFLASDGPFVASGAFVILLTVVLLVLRRRWPAGLAAWVCYAAALAPVLGVVQHGSQIAADRYSHFACMGLAVLIGAGVASVRRYRPVVVGAGVVGVIALASLTWRQVEVWRDSLSLWSHAAAVNPRNDFAINNEGVALFRVGRVDEALTRYERAARMNPSFEEPPYNLGVVLAERGDSAAAIGWYEEALRRRPAMAKARNNLGNLRLRLGQTEQAIAEFRKAIELEPSSPGRDERGRDPIIGMTYANLGTAYGATGRTADAISAFQQSLEREPDNTVALFGMGLALSESGRPADAVLYLKRLLSVEPDRDDGRELLLSALRSLGRHGEVVTVLRAKLARSPDDAATMNNLAWMLATSTEAGVRDGAAAVALARRACELAGDGELLPRVTLAAALAETGAYDDAAEMALDVRARAMAAGAADLVKIIDGHLAAYRQRRAIRER